MGMEGETRVYLEHLPRHHLHHAESKNQHQKSLRGEKQCYRMVNESEMEENV